MDNRLAKELYHQYTNLGINAEVKGILKNIPERYRRPIEYTLSTNILGAYTISTYAILPKYVKPKKRRIITASIELLFTLSMMYDDIFDGDEQRFKFPTAWKKYGKNLTNKAVNIGINEIEKFLKVYCGKMTARKLIDYINRGIISIKNHKKLNLNTSLKKILRNYTERSDFVTRFPIEVTFSKKDANKNIAIKALSHLYLGVRFLMTLRT